MDDRFYEDENRNMNDRYYEYDDGYEDDEDDEYYDDYEYDEEEEDLSWEWETYRKTTHIYLPPPEPVNKLGESENEMNGTGSGTGTGAPKTIIHFIGGTLFGSYPLQFYKPFLESIAEKSNSIIVATSIPVTLSSNPLNHFAITKEIAQNFRNAYRNVIVDEYGKSTANQMKIVGLGHSLGSRLHAILNTSDKCKRIGFEREGNIFVSFNNYNAMECVPGVKNLERGIEETFNTAEGRDSQSRGRRRQYSDEYYDEYEIGLSDVVNAVSEGIQDQLSTLKTVVTPDWDRNELEFQPSPNQLWEGLKMNYRVDKTLVVQFSNDGIDQSSKLTKMILEGSDQENEKLDVVAGSNANVNATTTSTTKVQAGDESNDSTVGSSTEVNANVTSVDLDAFHPDIKYAWLRGTHLTPVSYSDTFIVQAFKRAATMDQILSEAIRSEGEYRPKSKKRRKAVQNKDVENLTDSIAKYVTDILQ